MTIAVDFDGVIHAYSRGWQDGTIYDEPVPGALEGLRALMEQDAVFILTSRSVDDVYVWLRERGFKARTENGQVTFWNARGMLLVTNRKLPANVYLDDRAVRFDVAFGGWKKALEDIAEATA